MRQNCPPNRSEEARGASCHSARRRCRASNDATKATDRIAEHWGGDVVNCPFCHGFEARDKRLVQIVTHTCSGEPNGALVAEASGPAAGRALDVDAGASGDAIWLAERGWRVTASDNSRRAREHVDDIVRRARRHVG